MDNQVSYIRGYKGYTLDKASQIPWKVNVNVRANSEGRSYQSLQNFIYDKLASRYDSKMVKTEEAQSPNISAAEVMLKLQTSDQKVFCYRKAKQSDR